MSRHSNDFSAVKAKASLLNFISHTTGLKMAGSHLEDCPACHEGRGHFSLTAGNEEVPRYKCFRCGVSGTVIDFAMMQHSCTELEALKIVADFAGITLTTDDSRKEVPEHIRAALAFAERDTKNLLAYTGPDAALIWRGHNPETIRAEKVGLSVGGYVKWGRDQGFTDDALERSGYCKRKGENGKSHLVDFFFPGKLVFPVFRNGNLMNLRIKDPKKVDPPYQLPKEKQGGTHWQGDAALDRFDAVFLVEGEHDRLSIIDAGVTRVCASGGSLSDDQIALLNGKHRAKTLLLMMDNDDAGRGYVRKLAARITAKSIKVVVYGDGGDDPDSHLQSFTDGERQDELKRLEKGAVTYPEWEINQAAALPTLKEKRDHFEQVDFWRTIGNMKPLDQGVYVELLEKIGFSRKAIIDELTKSHDLRKQVQIYFSDCAEEKKAADPAHISAIIFEHFSISGRFFRDAADTVYLTYQDITYTVTNNTPFSALIERLTGILFTRSPGNSVLESLRNRGYIYGKRLNFSRWVATSETEAAIFINHNSPGNAIFKVAPGAITELVNGMNDDDLLLASSEKISPFTYRPQADIQEGFTLLRELVFKNLACENRQRYFILAWLISAYLLDFVAHQCHLKFSGSSAGGKSTAAKLLTMLLYGSEHMADPTGASAYSMAAQNPLLVIDNLEHEDLTRGIQKFLLLAATRGEKSKRKTGSDTATVDEAPRALVCITAIEPFTLPELINRIVDIWFDAGEYGNADFYEMDVLRNIKRHRDTILSAILKFISSEILPEIGTISRHVDILRTQHKGHAKERSNEFLALLLLILDKLLPFLPLYTHDNIEYGLIDEAEEIREAWILEQNRKARDLEVSSSTMLKLLDGVVWDHQVFRRTRNLSPTDLHPDFAGHVWIIEHPDYGLQVIETTPETITDQDTGETVHLSYVEFVVTSSMIVDAIQVYCKNRGVKNPYPTAAIFGARFKNDMKLLEKGGWELVTRPGREPHFKVIKGKQFFKFRMIIFNPTG